jgi:ATP-dependent exoDNAse (exonuclease V) beta subunit
LADYVGEHLTHGYATTVHSAQGVTADSAHAVLGENTTRSMLYVAMTRARDANTGYLYERATEQEYGPVSDGPHVLRRGTSQQASQIARAIIDLHDDVPVTAHQVAATAPHRLLPDRVAGLVTRRRMAVDERGATYTHWQLAADEMTATMAQGRAPATDRHRDHSSGMEM